MKVKIKTLTPIHIGTGKKLGALEFFSNYRIDYDKLFELIAEEKQEEFLDWIDQNPQISVHEIKSKFNLNQQDIINKCGLYSFRGAFQKDLNEGIKDSSYKLYIPGSSLKGSLRTALMFKVLSQNKNLIDQHLNGILGEVDKIWNKFLVSIEKINNQNQQDKGLLALIDKISVIIKNYELIYGYDFLITKIKKELKSYEQNLKEEKKNSFYEVSKIYNKTLSELKSQLEKLKANVDVNLIKKVFNCGVLKQTNGQTRTVYDDQKYDLLKLVKISDSTSVSTYENGEITELQVYALKKIAPHKTFKTYTESVKNNVELEFDISIDIEFLKRVKKELNDPNSDFGKKYFIGIEQKLRDLFDIDIKNDLELSEEKIVETLIKAWNSFGEAVSKLEKEWVESIKNKGNANVNSLNKLYSMNNKFKVGFGTGFSGMTILPLLLSDHTLKQNAYTFYKAVGIGFHKSTNTPLDINEFPFTRKYSNNQTIYDGFGWVKFVDGIDNQNNTGNSTEATDSIIISDRPSNSVIAEIIDDKSKPPKVKILEGEHSEKETIMPGTRLEGLGLSKGAKVYVKLYFDKKNLQKAEFKGKVK